MKQVAFIISIAQQAKPKVAGHSEDLRAQLISESSRVVSTSGSASAMMFSSPMLPKFQVPGFKFQVSDAGNLESFRSSSFLPLLDRFQQPPFGLSFTASGLAPVKCALLDYVDQTHREQGNKQQHLEVDDIAQAVCRDSRVS